MPGPLAALGLIGAGSGLLNYLGGRAQAGRADKLRQQLMELLSSESLGSETNNLFSLFRRSPMYTGLRTSAMESANRLGGQLQTGFARAGLDRTGIAQLALPIARSSFTRNFQNIDAQLFMQALSQARELIGSRADVLRGTSGPSAGQLATGNTLQSLMPLLLKYFESRL